MPGFFDALLGGANALGGQSQAAQQQQAGSGLTSLLGGALGGLYSGGATATNAKGALANIDLKGLTIEDVEKTIKSLPFKDRTRDLKIAIPPKFNYAVDYGTSVDTTAITVSTVTIPANVVYMISAGNVYQWNNVGSVSYPAQTATQQIEWPLQTVTIPNDVFQYQGYMNGIMNAQLGGIYPTYGTLGALGGYSVECNTTPMTPEQREAWVKAEAERAAKKFAAVKRAEGLLFTILKPQQVRQYEDHGYFETEVDDRIYRIHKRSHSGNVELIVNGKAIAKYCAHPSNCYGTPEVDTMISQFLMLQTDEKRFLATANKTRLM